jgi:drug/metabolite transporter (DMT)-like permease
MSYFLIIFYYFISAGVDVIDKFLLSKRKIRPLSYTFFTVVTGLILLVLWPWNFEAISAYDIGLDLLSGVLFTLAIYTFFKALSRGEVSRVVPFIFAIVPLTDILIGLLFGRNLLNIKEIAALWLLVPGAVLIVYRKQDFVGKNIALKISSAFLWSTYYALWQFAAKDGVALNHLMWNRIGAAGILLLLILVPQARKKVFLFKEIENKKQTSALFLLKQILGGLNFVYLSFLLILFKIPIVNALMGFRYLFLILAALVLSHYGKNILDENLNRRVFWQKMFAIVLIFAGTAILFI